MFDPDNVSLVGPAEVDDERVVVADRGDDGAWRVDHYHGGYGVEPTHFLDPGVPEGCPAAPDPEAIRARDVAERAAFEARIASERAEAVGRAAELDAAREAFWSDPDNLRRFALGGE